MQLSAAQLANYLRAALIDQLKLPRHVAGAARPMPPCLHAACRTLLHGNIVYPTSDWIKHCAGFTFAVGVAFSFSFGFSATATSNAGRVGRRMEKERGPGRWGLAGVSLVSLVSLIFVMHLG